MSLAFLYADLGQVPHSEKLAKEFSRLVVDSETQSPLGELFERSHTLRKGTKMIEKMAAIGDLLVAEGMVLLKPHRGLMTEAPWDECSNTLVM